MFTHRTLRHALLLALPALAALGCGDDGSGRLTNPADTPYALAVDPADFSNPTAIDNPYLPLRPGDIRRYAGVGERVEIEVQTATRVVMGIECVVVLDRAYEDDELVEETWDWFAQDDDGNVWYFGEDSHEVADGQYINAHGSWEAGVDGALPGIVMLARPLVGVWYRQEYFAGQAEDAAQVVSIGETVTTPAGTFDNCVKTLDLNALEPDVQEHKWYAPGVGVVKELEIRGGTDAVELIEMATR